MLGILCGIVTGMLRTALLRLHTAGKFGLAFQTRHLRLREHSRSMQRGDY